VITLPVSGLRVEGSRLLIARPSHPLIVLDARLLDRVAAAPAPAHGRRSLVALAGTAGYGAAALANLVPVWPVALGGLAALGLGLAWLDARGGGALVLEAGSLRVLLSVEDGARPAARLAAALAPWTRGGPIQDAVAHEDARRRLAAALARHPPPRGPDDPAPVSIGAQPVALDGDDLVVMRRRFALPEVRALAAQGENLALGQGHALQAALALLVVAAERRRREPEDAAALQRRIDVYEAWSGRRVGR
jgi:hypothetical protein